MSDNQQPPADERAQWEGPARASTENKEFGSRPGASEPWERDTINRLVFETLKEQRRSRRWGIFFKILMFAYLFLLLLIYQGGRLADTSLTDGDHTALVEIRGVIADEAEANADDIISAMRDAFKSKGTRGVILRINSPGGSPVQSGYVNDEILRLRQEYPNIPLYAVITDICASGGYYIAAGADKIYANQASIVGSIGVRMSGPTTFGFVEAMKKLGIERRELAAGENKAMLDPFLPLKEDEVAHMRSLLDTIHQQFIKVVKQGRGDRIKEGADLYTGLFWTGEQSLELGLIDGLGSASYVAKEIIGAEKIVDYTERPAALERFIQRFGMSIAQGLMSEFKTEQGVMQ